MRRGFGGRRGRARGSQPPARPGPPHKGALFPPAAAPPARPAPLRSSPLARRGPAHCGGGAGAAGRRAALRCAPGTAAAAPPGRGAGLPPPGRAGGSAARPEGRLKVGPGRASRGVPLGSLGSARRAFDRGEGCARREAAGRPSGAASGPGLVKSAEVWQHRPGHRVGGRCGSAGRLCPELRAALRPGAAPSGAERASAERSLCGELGAVCGCGTLR